jgi:hypothetical protein
LVLFETNNQAILELLVNELENRPREEPGIHIKDLEQTVAPIGLMEPSGEGGEVGNFAFPSGNRLLTDAGLARSR